MALRELKSFIPSFLVQERATYGLHPLVIVQSLSTSSLQEVSEGRVQLAGSVDELLDGHKLLTGPRRDMGSLPADQIVIRESHTDRQSTVLVRTAGPILDPAWVVTDIGLEELVLAYMASTAPTPHPAPLVVVRS